MTAQLFKEFLICYGRADQDAALSHLNGFSNAI